MRVVLVLVVVFAGGRLCGQSLVLTPPDSSQAGTLAQAPAEQSGLRNLESAEEWLARTERERTQRSAREQYENALSTLTDGKARLEQEQNTEAQGLAFSKAFLKLNIDAPDFVDAFEQLMEKYPLAIRDPFSAKLIRKGENAVRRADPARAAARLEKTRGAARQALESYVQQAKSRDPGVNLEADPSYIKQREALRAIEENAGANK